MGLKLEGARRLLRGGFFGSGIYIAAMSSEDTEFTGLGGYARIASTNRSDWDLFSGGVIQNTVRLLHPTPTADLIIPTHVGIYDAMTGGNLLFVSELLTDAPIPASGSQFGWDVGDIRLSFNRNASKLTSAGASESFFEGLLGSSSSTRQISLHSGQPTTSNQQGVSVTFSHDNWVELSAQPEGVTNNAIVDFGEQATDLQDITWVALRTGNAFLWIDALDNNPPAPVAGDRIIFSSNSLVIVPVID